MRWEDERYVRLYTRDTPEWTLLSWEARGLFSLLLRAVDRAGLMDMGRSGLKGVASLLRMPLAAVEKAMPELLEDGCVVRHGDVLAIRNFIEAQEANQSDAARKRAERERARDKAKAEELGLLQPGEVHNNQSQDVTRSSRAVTSGHAQSQPVTLSRAVPSQPSEPEEEKQTPVLPPEPGGSGSSCGLYDHQASPTQPPTEAPAEEPSTSTPTPEPVEAPQVIADAPEVVQPQPEPATAPQRPGDGQPTLFADPGPDVAPELPRAKSPKPADPDAADEIFEHYLAGWRLHVRGNRPPKLDDKRRGLVRKRTREGWSAAELKRACDGLWLSAWHIENKRTDFDLVMRDTTHVEMFLDKHPAASPPPPALDEVELEPDPRIFSVPIPPEAATPEGARLFVRSIAENLGRVEGI